MTSLDSTCGPSVTAPFLSTLPVDFNPSPTSRMSFLNLLFQASHRVYIAFSSSGERGRSSVLCAVRYRNRYLLMSGVLFWSDSRSLRLYVVRAARFWTPRGTNHICWGSSAWRIAVGAEQGSDLPSGARPADVTNPEA